VNSRCTAPAGGVRRALQQHPPERCGRL